MPLSNISPAEPGSRREYAFSLYKDSDREAVIELMKDVFSSEKMRKAQNFNPEFWRWQYQGSPWGPSPVILAKNGDEVIGQYANAPLRLKCGSRVLNAAIAVDLMVREAYRRRGLFKKMGEASNLELSKLGISLSIAFPSRNQSCSGFISKLGWFMIGNLDILARTVFFRMPRKNSRGIRIEQISTFPEGINGFWEMLSHEVEIAVVRRKEYLDWRYFNRPTGEYNAFLVYRDNILAGYFVTKVITVSKIKIGIIVDLFCINERDIMQSIVLKAADIFLRSGAHLCMAVRNKLNEDSLRESGFFLLPRRFSPKQYTLIARINKETLPVGMIKNINNWYVTFGDWDVI